LIEKIELVFLTALALENTSQRNNNRATMHPKIIFNKRRDQVLGPLTAPEDPRIFEDAEVTMVSDEDIFQDADEGPPPKTPKVKTPKVKTLKVKTRKTHDRVLDNHLKKGRVIQHTYKGDTADATYVGDNKVCWEGEPRSLSGFCRAHAVYMSKQNGYSHLKSLKLEFNGWSECNLKGMKKGEWGGDIGYVK